MAKDKVEAPAVSTNPALVEFPRDEWGMTAELRKAGLRAAASVRGNAEKHALLIATLRVIAQHAAARMPSDAVALQVRADKIASRPANTQRVAARPHGLPSAEVVVHPVTPEMEAAYG